MPEGRMRSGEAEDLQFSTGRGKAMDPCKADLQFVKRRIGKKAFSFLWTYFAGLSYALENFASMSFYIRESYLNFR